MSMENHYRVIVLGPVSSGKSSIIKRLVCHRFDNLPTYNSTFMGAPTDGIHMVRTEMPAMAPVGRSKPPTGADAARDILLELQDMLAHLTEDVLRRAPTWYEMAPKHRRGAGSTANSSSAKGGEAAVSLRTPSTPPSSETRLVERQDAAAAEAELRDAARQGGKVNTQVPPKLDAHPLMAVSFDEGKKQAQKEAARLLGAGGGASKPNPISVEHGAKGWLVACDLTCIAEAAALCLRGCNAVCPGSSRVTWAQRPPSPRPVPRCIC